MRAQKVAGILGMVIFLTMLFLPVRVDAWGPGGGMGRGRCGRGWYGYGRWGGYNASANFVQAEGKIVQIKTLPGPGRWGYPWIIVEVKDKAGNAYQFGIGPQWWGAPPELKPGAIVKISGFTPPGWAFRGVPYRMTCRLEFPKVGKIYLLRPCGWWMSPPAATNSTGNSKN